MSHWRAAAATALWLLAGGACSDSSLDGGPEAGASDVGIPADGGANADAVVLAPDVELIVEHDGGAPAACDESCDCPQGAGCVNNACRILANPVYCCEKPDCPPGQVCLGGDERPGTCRGSPDAGPDAGAPDLGSGYVGAYCETDSECTAVPGMTCWTHDEPPHLWGYCTISPCFAETDCPSGSHCLGFRVTNICATGNDCPVGTECEQNECRVYGCIQECGGELDCRSDAFCEPVPDLGFSICLPDCRDDVLDCAPRDGSVWCNRSTGRCEYLAMQSSTAEVGDPCVSNADCGDGDVCLGDYAFPFPGGLCTRICDVLPEATSCGAAETCQSYDMVGMCFADCVNGSCPDRANATCGELNSNWVVSSCIPM